MSETSAAEQCAAQVRQYDYARYFAAVFAPPDIRRALTALYSFNLELASTRERVSEPLIGEMRLQWWRDTVEGIFEGTVRNHAVAEEVAALAEKYDVPRAALDALIDARAFDLSEVPPEDMATLRRYVEATAGDLAGIAAGICGGHREAAVEAGTVWGLAGMLRAVPFHASGGRVRLPMDLLRRAGLRTDDVLSGSKRHLVAEAVAPLLAETRERLARLKREEGKIDRPLRPALAYVGSAGLYLDRLDRRGGDVFDGSAEPPRPSVQFRTLRTALTGKF
jgi:NADH dehydrogenase [ubiquinone] 1 alpha subcomplex assembly factor 6